MMTNNTEVRDIEPGAIGVFPGRLKRFSEETVQVLAESMKDQGLLHPILAEQVGVGAGYWVVAGRHRLEAARRLKWPSIRCVILPPIDNDHARLMEIDSDLAHGDLSPALRAHYQATRKEIYERVHPETKRGAAGGAATKAKASGKANRQVGEQPRYTKDAAKKTGKSERSVQREAERGQKIPDVAALAGTSLDKGEELDALTKLRSSTVMP
jgi:hypothetical protein